jgi:hypothetical protein
MSRRDPNKRHGRAVQFAVDLVSTTDGQLGYGSKAAATATATATAIDVKRDRRRHETA